MSKARDLANLGSNTSSLATDSEVTAAVAAEASARDLAISSAVSTEASARDAAIATAVAAADTTPTTLLLMGA